MSIKDELKRVPGLRAAVRLLKGGGRPAPFSTSAAYWEERYSHGGSSGAGSYNRLAAYKADFLNGFVRDNAVRTVLEFGSGDGAQLALAHYPLYTGVDVSMTAITLCRTKFASDPSKTFHLAGDFNGPTADLCLSLDVIYHLVEDEVFSAYMQQLFGFAERFVVIYSSNGNRVSSSDHVRHRRFTDWVERERPDWSLVKTEQNPFGYDPADDQNTSLADFYVYRRR